MYRLQKFRTLQALCSIVHLSSTVSQNLELGVFLDNWLQRTGSLGSGNSERKFHSQREHARFPLLVSVIDRMAIFNCLCYLDSHFQRIFIFNWWVEFGRIGGLPGWFGWLKCFQSVRKAVSSLQDPVARSRSVGVFDTNKHLCVLPTVPEYSMIDTKLQHLDLQVLIIWNYAK